MSAEPCAALGQGETINETGTMTGGGGRPRAGRMCLGTAAPRRPDDKASAAELASAEKELAVSQKVLSSPQLLLQADGPSPSCP